MDKPTGYATVGMLMAIAKSMALRYGVTNIADIQLDAASSGIKFILTSGDTITVPFDASELPFAPGSSGLTANNVQDAIYQVNNRSTYKTFPSSWVTNGTTLALMNSVQNDVNAKIGDAYLGEVTCTDLPFHGNAEITIEIKNDNNGYKTIIATLTSGNVAPYFWLYTYWNNGASVSGWIGFAPESELPTGFSTQEIETICEDIFYPALPAPQNVQASGTTISFDEVDGATSYEVFADGVSIGEYQVGGNE